MSIFTGPTNKKFKVAFAMTRLKRPEIFIIIAYLAFCFWYTNTSGPLTNTEIDAYLAELTQREAANQNIPIIEDFMRRDTGNQFVMVNLIDLNPTPPDLPATGPNADPMALVDHYMAHMYPTMFRRASHPIYLAPVQAGAIDLLNLPGASNWTQAALMRYRSRRDLMDIVTDPRFSERHDYKLGAMLKTIAVPTEPSFNPADPRLLLGLVAIIFLLLFRRGLRPQRAP